MTKKTEQQNERRSRESADGAKAWAEYQATTEGIGAKIARLKAARLARGPVAPTPLDPAKAKSGATKSATAKSGASKAAAAKAKSKPTVRIAQGRKT
jgi:hypothetical protein